MYVCMYISVYTCKCMLLMSYGGSMSSRWEPVEGLYTREDYNDDYYNDDYYNYNDDDDYGSCLFSLDL
jgi:hypothetical protein